VDSQATQYERLMVALAELRARIPAVLEEARAARAHSIATRDESAALKARTNAEQFANRS
jgi:hypothetical protein